MANTAVSCGNGLGLVLSVLGVFFSAAALLPFGAACTSGAQCQSGGCLPPGLNTFNGFSGCKSNQCQCLRNWQCSGLERRLLFLLQIGLGDWSRLGH